MSEWLSGLKSGDIVLVWSPWGAYGRPATVDRVTKAQILAGGMWFWRKTGTAVGNDRVGLGEVQR